MQEKKQTNKFKGYLTVITGVCIHLFCGSLYLWGNVSTYVVTYFHFQDDSNATLANALLVLPLSFIIQSLFNPVGAYLQKRWNPKLIIGIGLTIMSASILIASYCQTWWTFVLVYSIGYPAGIGIVYWVPIMCGWEWFPNNKGLVSGSVVAGYGFGAFIFGFITTAIANPNDLKVEVPIHGPETTDKLFPFTVGEKVPEMYRICLIIWVCLGLTAVFGVSRNPDFVE